jgi:transcriptional regulator with XRE-family HTH domain
MSSNQNYHKELAEGITRLRNKNSLSQEQLATKLGVSSDLVEQWESTKAIPDMANLLQLSNTFHVSMDELVKGSATSDSVAGTPPKSDFKKIITICITVILVSGIVASMFIIPAVAKTIVTVVDFIERNLPAMAESARALQPR